MIRESLPPGVEVTADSVHTQDGKEIPFGDPVHFARAYAPYFDARVSRDDSCNGPLELFGVALQR